MTPEEIQEHIEKLNDQAGETLPASISQQVKWWREIAVAQWEGALQQARLVELVGEVVAPENQNFRGHVRTAKQEL